MGREHQLQLISYNGDAPLLLPQGLQRPTPSSANSVGHRHVWSIFPNPRRVSSSRSANSLSTCAPRREGRRLRLRRVCRRVAAPWHGAASVLASSRLICEAPRPGGGGQRPASATRWRGGALTSSGSVPGCCQSHAAAQRGRSRSSVNIESNMLRSEHEDRGLISGAVLARRGGRAVSLLTVGTVKKMIRPPNEKRNKVIVVEKRGPEGKNRKRALSLRCLPTAAVVRDDNVGLNFLVTQWPRDTTCGRAGPAIAR